MHCSSIFVPILGYVIRSQCAFLKNILVKLEADGTFSPVFFPKESLKVRECVIVCLDGGIVVKVPGSVL